ncbi:MAG: preprotein translocase subunit SecE [Parcubacteria group bacterium]|nr:preprotein translocase subunit SecE [Parcubacteria group bacterium]
MSAISKYIKESVHELKQVVWPTKKEAVNHTLLVISISVGVAIFLGIIDYVLSFGVEKIIQ